MYVFGGGVGYGCVSVCVCMDACIYAFINSHTHTHTHTHTHKTHILLCVYVRACLRMNAHRSAHMSEQGNINRGDIGR